MNDKDRTTAKNLNKIGVDTRFISIYKDDIYINNLKFSKFSRKKEEEFHKLCPDSNVIRSTLLQKICVKVSRTIKNQIKPRETIYIADDSSMENILLYILLEPYKRKYGIRLTCDKDKADKIASPKCLDDYINEYVTQMTNAERITDTIIENTVYPLEHVEHEWITDWIRQTGIKYEKTLYHASSDTEETVQFLRKHIPNVKESMKQSIKYLDEHAIKNDMEE